jgi:streptogramin lyase
MGKAPRLSMIGLLACMIGSITVFVMSAKTAPAESDKGIFLTGAVHSDSGQKLEGVTLSAKADGQSITTTVFTDEQGDYYFPATMTAGNYAVWAQAEGYDTGRVEVELRQGVRRQDFTLKVTKDVVKQMTGQEYVTSLAEDTPLDRRMKNIFYDTCTGCHEPNYILQNRFDEKGWEAVINLMSKVVNGAGVYGGPDQAPFPVMLQYKKDLATYLFENRGPGESTMKIKLRPRPTGDPARGVITEYDVPLADALAGETDNGYATNDGSDWSLGTPSALNHVRGIHDTQADLNGNIWFTYAEGSYTRSLGVVNSKTGRVTDIRIPGANGMAALTHGLAMDQKGILWFTTIGLEGGHSGLGRLDPNTMKFEIYPPSKGMASIVNGAVDVDTKGFVWVTTGPGVLRFDPESKEFEEFRSPTQDDNGPGGTYGIAVDHDGNGWWTQINIDRVDKADLKTHKVMEMKVPARPAMANAVFTKEDRDLYSLAGVELTDFSGLSSQGPRRMGADRNSDTVWVCDYWGGNLAKFDIHSMKITTYSYPTPESAPYDAVVDQNHNVWVNLTNGDSIAKFDPKTEQWTEYPLPSRGIDLRHISLSNLNGATQVVVGYTRNSKVARIAFRSKEDLEALTAQVRSEEKRLSASAQPGR